MNCDKTNNILISKHQHHTHITTNGVFQIDQLPIKPCDILGRIESMKSMIEFINNNLNALFSSEVTELGTIKIFVNNQHYKKGSLHTFQIRINEINSLYSKAQLRKVEEIEKLKQLGID